ncbi:MAG: U32 family peptidase [Candidatus Shikimatogenerans bostrichidophilus]|nr:MAG: U32 family peptidase [Candidatus Shikimatogenerans bostrichidophilus]
MKKIEILSPAGNYESLYAAIKAKADSIYFGVEQLNMRTLNNSFKIKDIEKISKICKDNKIKKYLTLNTIIYDHDIYLAKKILNISKKNKIDGVIAMDNFIINYSKKIKLPVHISTQVNITNLETIKFYSKYCDVVVLSRELNLNQIKYITNQIKKKKIKGVSKKNIKIEIFCHGSLCMAISGKCYLSLHSYNSSANRGACKQNCRRQYLVKDLNSNINLKIDNKYIMSSKDLCTINFLDKIIKSGVNILKIEGRSKSPEYVYTTTKCYKKAVELIKKNKFNIYNKKKLLNKLKTVYNRGFWSGYYLGQKIGEWAKCDGSISTYKKEYLGLVKEQKNKRVKILIQSYNLELKNIILIIGEKIGVKKIQINNLINNKFKKIKKAKKGDICYIYLPFKVYKKNKIYKLINNDNNSIK